MNFLYDINLLKTGFLMVFSLNSIYIDHSFSEVLSKEIFLPFLQYQNLLESLFILKSTEYYPKNFILPPLN